MALVDYSDSDGSGAEESVAKPTTSSTKAGFQKVVDRSNPGKIRVSLPQLVAAKEPAHEDAPPAKRTKTGGGAFSGFNSFLPAPKRAGQASTTLGGGAVKKGLGAGVNLKTGSAPGFSREPEPEREDNWNNDDIHTTTEKSFQQPDATIQLLAEEVKLVGKPLMFRPLSVANKPKKKKKATITADSRTSAPKPATSAIPATPAPRAKVSLFSMTTESEDVPSTTLSADYTPMMIHDEVEGQDQQDQEEFTPSYEDYTPNASLTGHLPPVPTPPVSQSLDDIAGDLHLSAAERRQLFGRQKGGRGQAATNIINFNTDQEYLHNEELRAAGEQVQHNAVRALAPGKHSLKQLVNAAQSQKEALEESFAKGKNNRAEASSRYGW